MSEEPAEQMAKFLFQTARATTLLGECLEKQTAALLSVGDRLERLEAKGTSDTLLAESLRTMANLGATMGKMVTSLTIFDKRLEAIEIALASEICHRRTRPAPGGGAAQSSN